MLGAQLGHGYAFFSQKARENDYLWGRLDAAERVVRLLLTRTTVEDGKERSSPAIKHPDYQSRCRQVFGAVLEEDSGHLPTLEDDIKALNDQIDALGAQT